VQKMAGHASASTTAGYDRRDRGVRRRAAVLLQVPYTVPELPRARHSVGGLRKRSAGRQRLFSGSAAWHFPR
jgi:hypothetical protein